jgi:phosphoribosylaminoimidazole carboxylase (NCAIR synthetase)
MTEDDLKLVLSKYQQKCFELFNQNLVLETQIEQLNKSVNVLTAENEKLKSTKLKKTTKEIVEQDFT